MEVERVVHKNALVQVLLDTTSRLCTASVYAIGKPEGHIAGTTGSADANAKYVT